MSLPGAPVHRGNRRAPSDAEESSTVFDRPYGEAAPQPPAEPPARPLRGHAPAGGLAFTGKSKEESYLGTKSSWIVDEPLLAKGKVERGPAKRGDGPLALLGGGLDNLTRSECALLAGLVMLALFVRLWRIDRPGSVV